MAIRESMAGAWHGLDRGMKLAFSGAAVLMLAAIVWGVYVVAHDNYGILFSQLTGADAAAIVDSLKKQKVPYKLSDGGATISVPAESVYETRLALLSSNVALSGGVGFEIFDKQGLGATEQSQRVSYQRALQGELARTISTLDNVKAARVLLVLPESTLFKRDKQEATAAVTLTLKSGANLNHRQIIGVQRLVAASVAGLDPSHVIITDQSGVTLSAADPAGSGESGIAERLELQRQVESHIAKKISRLLDSTFGPGQAIISVAVALGFDAVKTTTQDVVPVRGANGAEGGVVRKRQVVTGGGSDASSGGEAADTDAAVRRTSSTLEVEYEYGRRVEEVIAAPGAVKRITVGVIVPPRISEEQQRRIKEFVQVAAGIDATRGDLVSVQSLAPSESSTQSDSIGHEVGASALPQQETGSAESPSSKKASQSWWQPIDLSLASMLGILFAVLVLGTLFGILLRGGRQRRELSERQRSELLQEIRRAMGEESRVSPLQARQ